MELRGLEAFVAVADEGSITSAASTLGYSQPAVSRQLAALERTLGGRLYFRVRDGVALTDTGRTVLPLARNIVVLARSLTSDTPSAPREGMQRARARTRIRTVATGAAAAFGAAMTSVAPPSLVAGASLTLSVVAATTIGNRVFAGADVVLAVVGTSHVPCVASAVLAVAAAGMRLGRSVPVLMDGVRSHDRNA